MLVDGFQPQVVQYHVDTVEVDIDDSTLDQYWHNIEENDLVSFDQQYLSSQLHLLLFHVKQMSNWPNVYRNQGSLGRQRPRHPGSFSPTFPSSEAS